MAEPSEALIELRRAIRALHLRGWSATHQNDEWLLSGLSPDETSAAVLLAADDVGRGVVRIPRGLAPAAFIAELGEWVAKTRGGK